MSAPKVVILGVDGMLGHKLFQQLRERLPGVVGTVRRDVSSGSWARVTLLQGADVIGGVDVTDFDRLRATLAAIAPDVVINAVGVIKQRGAAHEAIPSITINSLLPHRLAEAAAGWGGRLIHFSTDCVFNGRRGQYREDDQSDAEDLYGRSKFLGEVDAPNAVTLRTSIIGRELSTHQSLLDWFLRQDGKAIKGYRRAIYSGLTTNEMARVAARVIEAGDRLSGLFQVVSTPIAKYDLLHLLREAYGLSMTIAPDDGEVCDRSMRGDKFAGAIGYTAPAWPELVRDLAQDPTPYDAWEVWRR